MSIQQECTRRGITRLCHFTQSRNLAHILGDTKAILSSQQLQTDDLPYNPTDSDRWDGCEDMICCSIEFPNVYYFNKARTRDLLFKDWVVLIIKPDYLWMSVTKFCPTNAAKQKGALIKKGDESFLSLFAPTTIDISYYRSSEHLDCAPTNVQAEVLVSGQIPLDDLTAIAVSDADQAKREICRASLQGLSINKDILIVPDFYNRQNLAQSIHQGNRVTETIFDPLNDD